MSDLPLIVQEMLGPDYYNKLDLELSRQKCTGFDCKSRHEEQRIDDLGCIKPEVIKKRERTKRERSERKRIERQRIQFGRKNQSMTDSFHFIRPLEAPVFNPTAAEFQDPLHYINKIRPLAEKAGICKIRPPPNWQPPFAVDVDSFKFTPRVQRLNELEAKTRIKLNFLDQIAKFWELQGSRLRIPIIDRKALDLYSLHKAVQAEGGKEKVNNDKKWNRLAVRIGYEQSKNYGTVLKTHYEKLLYPYDVFQESKDKLKEKGLESPMKKPFPAKMPLASPKMGGGKLAPKTAKKVRSAAELMEDEGSTVIENTSKELRRLAFYGAGPKMAGFNVKNCQNLQLQDVKQRTTKAQPVHDPLAKYMCQVCDRGDVEASMLLCDGCDDSYHTFCLQPPLMEVPKGDWRCPKCLAEEVSKPGEAFGFEQAHREYTLQQFGEMADQFKTEYFNMPVHVVPSDLIEKEFWRIVSAIDEDVTVEYGADLHSMDHGSGFPTEGSSNIQAGDAAYIKSGWNLNNLPVLPGSVLGYINADISGMKVPWMYVGMCFATFCWHNEDHWSYSINYLHWGEVKTWYGVPGSRADDFENAMKQAAPELFQSQPDLLHQLVTIMNPNILMKAGVPVYRLDQKAGEFIVTFPRAYHAGFNQGYNFAEAVNFAPADWLSVGRNCIDHYSTLHRYCVFSHDELVCKMSSESTNLDLIIAMATKQDIHKMFETEKENRRIVLNWGAKRCERAPFEVLPDDERICDFCKTTCFLSAVSCPCTNNRLVCLKHYDKLCQCSPEAHILKYRFTLDELPVMIRKIHDRTRAYEKWMATMKNGLSYGMDEKMELETLRELMKEAETSSYPKTHLLDSAKGFLTEAEKCSEVAQKLSIPIIRTRTRNDDSKFKLNLNELTIFADQLESLPVRLKESSSIRILMRNITDFKVKARELLKQPFPKIDDLKACLSTGLGMDIELPEVIFLQCSLDRRKWLEQVEAIDDSDTLWTVDYLNKCIEAGSRLEENPEVEHRINSLKELSCTLNSWEDKAKAMINPIKKSRVKDLERLLEEAKDINVALPSLPTIRDIIRKTVDFIQKLESIKKETPFPFLDELESITTKGESIPVVIKELHVLNSQINGAKLWKEKCSKAFLKKNTTITLLEALIPRKEIFDVPSRGRKKRWSMETTSIQQMALLLDLKVKDVKSSGVLSNAFTVMQQNELCRIKEVRAANLVKRQAENGEGRYCVCQAPINNGFMIRCEICFEWFHATCVPLAKLSIEPVPGVSSHTMTVHKIASGLMKYFCPCCGRSRRPKLEIVLKLLVSLQELPVRLPESEALHCLAERAVGWLDGARILMNRADIKGVLQIMAATPPTIPSTKTTTTTIVTTVEGEGTSKKTTIVKTIVNNEGIVENEEIEDVVNKKKEENENPGSEHAYASFANSARNGHQRKANLNPSKLYHGGNPMARLPLSTLKEIEDVVLAGDLMEVAFDESEKLWRILESNKPRPVVPNILDLQKMIEEEILRKNLGSIKTKRTVQKRASAPNPAKRPRRASGVSDDGKKRNSEGSIKRKRKMLDDEIALQKKKDASNQEYDEDCAAEACRQPSGKEVNWVQCDIGCEGWFHLVCVGLKKTDVKKMEHYECPKCKRGGKSLSNSEDSSSESDSRFSKSGKRSVCSNKENTSVESGEENSGRKESKLGKKLEVIAARRRPKTSNCNSSEEIEVEVKLEPGIRLEPGVEETEVMIKLEPDEKLQVEEKLELEDPLFQSSPS